MRSAALVLALGLGLSLTACGDDEDASDDAAGTVADPVSTTAASPGASSSAGPSPELESALDDVRTAAPRLESLYRGKPYPTELAAVVKTLPDAGLELSKGNKVGAYKYDPDAVEFVLCIENSSGAFATYDTAPMATGEQGESGGCPTL